MHEENFKVLDEIAEVELIVNQTYKKKLHPRAVFLFSLIPFSLPPPPPTASTRETQFGAVVRFNDGGKVMVVRFNEEFHSLLPQTSLAFPFCFYCNKTKE